ncbi:hypothetical protein HHK36_014970 [Tetracentron sinense]|uniref:Serine-threonine/tyrosine-protein kinase catalytic domain-containing protein n=1 Tax=Tetracentron sinense TaxID=13715 RepID=A0A834Z161_TETSI|nr:hypothetical protein HHK36_014970 [Tetracentron sinense]
MGLLSVFCGCLEKKEKENAAEEDDDGDSWNLFFELLTLQVATDFFSELNQLGHGGFGPVYKVHLIRLEIQSQIIATSFIECSGYMAPEYALHGYLSVKTDVFSFGVLVLEIVSGRKNHDRELDDEKADLLSYTWMLSQQGKALELVDPNLSKYNRDEAAMCIQLGLLCCQAIIPERPEMNSVNLMLSSDSFNLPRPGKPGIQGRGGRWSTTSSALTHGTCTVDNKASRSIFRTVSSVDEGR